MNEVPMPPDPPSSAEAARPADAALAAFSPHVREWFARAFDEPTPAQVQAWPAIAAGGHTLISAPTGSGKTLAAFLWALDRLMREPSPSARHRSIRLVYVSPLKALGYDVERNLGAPLRGIGADIRVATRTGDTLSRERQAMLRTPPDILITTPESLYLMLTSQARRLFAGTEWVIVDEIHAVAQTKRGAHLAVTLERLAEAAGRDVQRIGLSATQRPLEEVARYLTGPGRPCSVVDAGVRRPLDLRIHVPVESMSEPDTPVALESVPGGGATMGSIWPAIYPELLRLVRQHRSTLVFVNNRRAAERVALRLNDLAARAEAEDGGEGEGATGAGRRVIARAHHGSLAREERLTIEAQLKAGELPCLVATSSLELGIDMGAVDLVVQIESPKSVARGLQRIGRAGHGVGQVSRGRIFPKFRADLVECAVVTRRMREGLIETTVVPHNPLDVLAQQLVAMAAAADPEPLVVADVLALLRRTWTYAELERRQLDNVLDMLDGRYPSHEFAELRPRIVWDRSSDTIRARPGARALATANPGTIPDRGLFSVNLPDGRRVGELDEEMVYEARTGQSFLLGASSWRIEEITRDRVVVTPAPGASATVPFWHGESVGRPLELGEALGRFMRWALGQSEETLEREYDLDERAARNLLAYLREQEAATGVVPSDRVVVVERFRDEIGDWRLCLLTPFGGRVHAAWALAISARMRALRGQEADAIWSDDGVVLHLPDSDEPPDMALVLVDPEEAHDLVVGELRGSALFGARFRENAARALLIPRAAPGRRMPLWQQRLKAQSLLEVARRYPEFPLVLETFRECLRDVLDMPGFTRILRRIASREVTVVEAETPVASPFASSLLFDYIAAYMYEGDTPRAERRAAALALDRDLLNELLGQEELRDLIDADALALVEADLQHTSDRARARSGEALHDVLRQVGDLSEDEVSRRVAEPEAAAAWLARLRDDGRAVPVALAGEVRWIAAQDAGLYRDALGASIPGGLPPAFLAPIPGAQTELIQRYARTHGPFVDGDLRRRYGVDMEPALALLEQSGRLVRGELRPLGTEREWCDPDVLRRIRRASLAALRREVEPVEQPVLARFLAAWQGADQRGSVRRGVDGLRDVLGSLQALPLPVGSWERDVLPARLGAYSPQWLDELCAGGEVVWVGLRIPGSRTARVSFYFRDEAPVLGPPRFAGQAPHGDLHEVLRRRLEQGACFFADLLLDLPQWPGEQVRSALWDLVWAGEVTNDAFAPLRAHDDRSARSRPRADHGGHAWQRRRLRSTPPLQGRWSLTAAVFGADGRRPDVPTVELPSRERAWAELLLERHGVVMSESVRAEGVPGGFAALYGELSALETLGKARRGYFVEGLGGAQFALPGAVERLRSESGKPLEPLVLAVADPAQPYGAVLAWPQGVHPPARQFGAYVVLVGGAPALTLEAGGESLGVTPGIAEEVLHAAFEALTAAVLAGRVGRLALERIDGLPATESPHAGVLVFLGFRRGLQRLTLTKSYS